jgi:endonuclease I
LKTSLKNIITNGHTPQSYDALWNQYKVTDIKPREVGSGSAYVIWDIYSDKPGATDPYNYTPGTNQCGNYSGEGVCYNREHSFPKSWFNDEMPAYSDYNHILPTDGYVNGKRSNWPYGEVASASWTSLNGSKLGSSSTAGVAGTVFEPINEYKGDVARAYLYMVTRYQDRVPTWANYATEGAKTMQANTYPSVNVNYLRLMIKWHTQDPVSSKEIDRNNGTYSFQGNRNPFIDHPEFVDAVWSNNCPGLGALPVDIVYFGGKLACSLVKLDWIVENEINFDSYEIEKSVNGTYYKTVGIVKSANIRQYQFADNVENNRGQRVYYRIKKVDRNGSFKYSEVFSVHIPFNNKFSVYPNPASSFIQFQLNNNINGYVSIRITDIAGRLAVEKVLKVNGSNIQLSTDGLSNGTYFITVNINGESYLQKVVISN